MASGRSIYGVRPYHTMDTPTKIGNSGERFNAGAATEDEPSEAVAATCPPWFTTYAPGSFKGERTPISPPDLLAKIQREAQPGADNHAIGLIMPSTFHELQVRNQDLPAGAEMLLYCGIADSEFTIDIAVIGECHSTHLPVACHDSAPSRMNG